MSQEDSETGGPFQLKVTINTGSLHPELEETLLNDLERLKEVDPLKPLVVLAGSRLLCEYLLWRTTDKFKALVNVHFVTFAELARNLSLWDRIGDSRLEIPDGGEELLIGLKSQALSENNYFYKVRDFSGFHRAAIRTFNDLDEAAVALLPDSLPKLDPASGKWISLGRFRNSYQQDAQSYRRRIDDYMVGEDAGMNFRNRYGCDHLHVYGIYDLTGLQLRFIENLCRGIHLTFYLPYHTTIGDFGSAFDYVKPTFHILSRLNDAQIKPRNPVGGCTNSGYSGKLFCYRSNETSSCFIPNNRNTRIFSAAGRTAEIEALVSRINEEALWNGTPLDSIGILLWNPTSYRIPLINALRKAGISYCDTIGTRLSETDTGRFVIDLMNMVGQKLSCEQLVNLLASYEIKQPENGEIPDTSAWISILHECGIVEGAPRQWQDAMEGYRSRNEDRQDCEDNNDKSTIKQIELLVNFLDRLFDQLETFPETAKPSHVAEAVCQLIQTFMPNSPQLIRTLEIISSTAALDSVSQCIDRKHYCDIVSMLLDRIRIDRGRFRTNGVTIMDKMNVRGLTLDILFIPGLGQDEVPVKSVEDAIITDFEREQLSGAITGGEETLLPLQKRRHLEEQLLFALAVDSCSKKLILSFSDWDERRGEARFASRYLLEMCRLLVNRPVTADKIFELPFYESVKKDAAELKKSNIEVLVRQTFDVNNFPLDWTHRFVPIHLRHAAVKQLYSGRDAAFDRILIALHARRHVRSFTRWDGFISGDGGLPPLIPEPLPVTALEAYAECPFNYFMQKFLGAVRWEKPEHRLDLPPNIKGMLIHRILKQFWQSAKDVGKAALTERDEEWAFEMMMEHVAGVFAKYRSIIAVSEAVWKIARQNTEFRLRQAVRWFCREDVSFTFHEAEVLLEKELILPCEDGEFSIALSGRVDRIDLSEDGKSIRVIDYKTGKSASKPKDYETGKTLQLPIYLKMFLDDRPGLNPETSETAYFDIQSTGDVKPKYLSGAEIIEHSQQIGEVVKILSQGMAAGLFIPIPFIDRNKDNCRNCSSSIMCNLNSRKKYPKDEFASGAEAIRQILAVM